MALVDINTIKNWFKTGMIPKQEQFWSLFDSYRHKNDKVPVSDIEGIDQLLFAKGSKQVLDTHLTDQNSHAGLFNNKVDKVPGKGLSENDFTSTDKALLATMLQRELLVNKTENITGNLNSTEKYPSIKGVVDWVTANVQGVSFLGSAVPTSTPTGTGAASWMATEAGTYTNFGGVVVSANSLAVISRTAAGAYSISQTPLNLSTYSKIGENKISPWAAKSYVSGEQVNHLGVDWVSNALTVAGDVPGTSNKWRERLSGFADLKFINPDTIFNGDELAVIKAIRSVKIYNANHGRKYVIRFLCNNDATYKYNICIADKLTGQEQIISIPNITSVGGVAYLSLNVTLGTDEAVNIKMAINYSSLEQRVYINVGYAACNLVFSPQSYVDISPSDIQDLSTKVDGLNNSVNSILVSSNELYIKQEPPTWSIKYWTSTGTLGTYLDYCHSNYFKVIPNSVVSISRVSGVGAGTSAKTMAFFDINYNFVCFYELYSAVVNSALSANFENIAYVSFSHNNINNINNIVISINNNTEFEKIDKRVTDLEGQSLSGKTAVILGDSIMMLMRTNSFGDTQNWDALKTKLGLTNLYNLGLGGATWQDKGDTNNTSTPTPDSASSYISNEIRWLKRLITGGAVSPHLIVVAAGTNSFAVTGDYTAIMAMSFSTLEASFADRSTLYGGLRYNLETLTKDFPNATIIVFSPIQSAGTAGRTYDALKLTSEAIKKMAGRYSCTFVNSLDEIGIVQNYEVIGGNGRYLDDGLHPNTAGKNLFANFYSNKIKAHFVSKT